MQCFFSRILLLLWQWQKSNIFFFFTQYTRNYSDKELMRHYACVKRWWLLSLRTPYNPIQYYRSPCPRAPRPFISPIHTSYSAQHVVCVGLQSMRSTCMCLCTHIRKQTTQLRQKVFRISYVSWCNSDFIEGDCFFNQSDFKFIHTRPASCLAMTSAFFHPPIGWSEQNCLQPCCDLRQLIQWCLNLHV